MTDDIPAAKVEAVARAMCWAAGCMGDGCRAERRCRMLFWTDYKADSVAAIRAADAWDAEQMERTATAVMALDAAGQSAIDAAYQRGLRDAMREGMAAQLKRRTCDDAANRHAAMHGSAEGMHVNVGTIKAPQWWAD